MVLLAALLMLCVAVANYLVHRDVMYPGFLQASLWFIVVMLLFVHQGMFHAVSDGVFLLLVAGVLSFSLGAFVGSYNHKPFLMRNYLLAGTLPGRRVVIVVTCVVLVGLVLYLKRAVELASTGPSSNAFINLRFAVSGDDPQGTFGALSYFVGLAYVLAAIVVLRRQGFAASMAPRTVVVITVLVGIVFGAMSSGRGVLLPLIIVVAVIPTVLRVTKPVMAGITLVVTTVLVFAAGGLALGKGGALDSTAAENWTTMRESFVIYAVGPVPALDVFVANRGADLEMGVNSFRTIHAALHALGFQTTVVPLVQEFVDVPMPTNVYTVYQPYIKDFGILGAVASLCVLGFFHSLLYRQATRPAPHAAFVFLFALSIFPLVMQAFQDSYFSLLSTWIQYGTYAVVFFVLLGRREYGLRWHERADPRAEM